MTTDSAAAAAARAPDLGAGAGRTAPRPHRMLGPLGRRLLVAFTAVALSSVLVLTIAALVGTDRGLAASQQAEREQALARVAAAAAAAYAQAGGWQGADLSQAQAIADGVQANLIVRDTTGQMIWPGRGNGPGPGAGPGAAGNAGATNAVGPTNAVGATNGAGPANGARAGSGAGPANGPRAGNGAGPGNRGPAASTRPTTAGAGTRSAGAAAGSGGVGIQQAVIVDGVQVGTVRLVFPNGTVAGRSIAWGWVGGAAAVALLMALAVSWYVSRRLARPLLRLAGAARAFAAGDRRARAGVRAPGEIGEVAHAFDTMADEVVRAETVRRQLAADVAHELRTPLAALQAGLEEVRDGYAEPDVARLASLHDQALRLGRVVADLADLSAAESAALSLRLTTIDLGDLVEAAVDGQEPMLRAAGLDLQREIRTGVRVYADPDRLHQAIVNLLANAARYCAEGDEVTVRVDATEGTALAEVADTGPGIAAEDLPHVFERLWRGRDRQGVAGSGIGLAVVRELVTANRGTVTVDSALGAGARFTIRLPLSDHHAT